MACMYLRIFESEEKGAAEGLSNDPASCGEDGVIMLWDLESGQSLRTLRRDRPYELLARSCEGTV